MPTKQVTIHGVMTWEGEDHTPEHPIYNPPGIWGPNDPRPTPPIVIPPDAIAPGVPTHPIYLPVYPSHPIVIPPDAIGPGVPTHPIYLPPVISGPPGPWPTPPIVLPPDAIAPGVPAKPVVLPPAANVPIHGSMIWKEGHGWVFVPDALVGGNPPTIWGPTDPRPNPVKKG